MAKSRDSSRVRLFGVTGRKRSDLLLTTALQATTLLVLALPAMAQPAPNARPAGGTVVAGGATISQSASTTTIDQTTQRAAINWQSFNVGSQQTVTFAQPSSSAVALNRVTGPDPSQIAGHIDANGQIVIVNQAGVTFYKGSQVNAQSLIVSSANVSNTNFMAGKMVFDQAGGANAAVVNQGTITVKQAGLAALVAPRVANSGVINAKLGHVVLAGAKTATLDLYGDGLLALDVSNQVTTAPVGANGKPVTALVTNSGTIAANGGTVQLTAAAADGVLQTLVQSGGRIVANSVGGKTGTVTVDGIGGSVSVTGLISATGGAVGTTGGQVEVNATSNVTLGARSRINASGYAGGGTVAIGTTLQRATGGPGTPSTRTATNVTVRKGATIAANGTKSGNGGRVTVLSTADTDMAGSIAATGGGLTGNGGFVEVSGDNLQLSGLVNLGAPVGSPGTLLLDPTNLTIVSMFPGSLDNDFNGSGTLAFNVPDSVQPPSTVSTGQIGELGALANVVIQATNSIDVQASFGVANGLTLQSGGNLTVESTAGISANGNMLLQAGMITASGGIVLNGQVTTGGTLQLIAGTGGIALNAGIFASTVDVNTTGGGVAQPITAGITVGALTSSQGVTGNVSFLGNNEISVINAFTVLPAGPGFGDFKLINDGPLLVGGVVATPGGNVYLEAVQSGITIGVFSGVTTQAGGTAGFQADSFTINTAPAATPGFVNTGTFELAPSGIGQTETLGILNSTGLSLASLANITATDIRIGAVTESGASGPVTTAAAITIAGTFDNGGYNLELDAQGAIDGSGGPLINVATLSGTGGAWTLTPPISSNNTIAALGDITATSFSLNDGVPLTVIGTVSGGSSITIDDVGLLTIQGVVAADALDLTGDDVDIPGVANGLGGGAVALTANLGTISETGTLIAGVLTGTAVGTAIMLGASASANQVDVLSIQVISFPDAGHFDAGGVAFRDGTGLTIGGQVNALAPAGQVFLESAVPAGITIAATGAVSAKPKAGLVSLETDFLLNQGAVSGATIELAPMTGGGTVTLGGEGSGLSLPTTAGLTMNNLTVGAVTQPTGGGQAVTAGGVAITGGFTFAATGSLTLDASSAAGTGATGLVTQSAPLTDLTVLSGTANSFALTNSANQIGTLVNLVASAGDADVESAAELYADGVSATVGNVYLASPSSGAVILEGPVSAANRVSVLTNTFGLQGGVVDASTFELAPFSPGGVVTLGASGGVLSVTALTGITAETVRLGAVTPPYGVAPNISAGAVTIAGTFNASGAATLELDATGAISQSAPLINVATLAANGSRVVLTNPGNLIGAGSGMTATAGNIVLVDGENLALNGSYTGNDLFFEVARAGGNLTIGGAGPATLGAASGASISLVADGLTANTSGSIGNAGGTVELAPFSSINVSLAGTGGTGGMLISGGLLSNISVGGGTLVIGGYTNLPAGGSTFVPTAGAISLDGAVDLGGRAGTLVLLANGSVTEPGGPLTVGTVTGASVGDFSLSNPANLLQASTGITAAGGNVVVATDPTMTLTGTYTGNNLFFEVTLAGGSLALGDPKQAATLIASTGGRVSLVADAITATAASTITAPYGTLEVAPYSAINESVLGTNATGQLLVDGTLLGDVTGGMLSTLTIGGYTPAQSESESSGGGLVTSAASVTLDGAINLTTLATNLQLLASGSVTEPGGPLTVANVYGASGGNFALTNPANAIGQSLGIAASGADVVLVDGTNLTLTGAHSGNNLFFEVAVKGGTLSLGGTTESSDPAAQLTAATGGRISLVADQLTETPDSVVTAPGGTLELAPFSALPVSLFGTAEAGTFVVDPTMLAIVTPGLGTLTVGGYTNEPAGGTIATPSASSLSVDGTVTLAPFASGLNLLATGAITQAAPLVNVGTLAATGGSVTLTNTGNLIANGAGITATAGNIVLVDGESLTLNGSYSGNDLFFEVAAKGDSLTVGGEAPATLTAAPGALIALVGDVIVTNTAGTITNLGGTVEIAPFSPLNLTLGGSGGSAQFAHIDVGQGTLVVGGYTNLPAGGTSLITTAGSITLTGALSLTGTAGTVEFLANGSVTEPGGPLDAGTVTGVATGDFALTNPNNQIAASTGITSKNGSVILVDDQTLQLTGSYIGNNLFFQVAQTGGGLALGYAAAPAVLTTATGGRISLVADSITATPASSIVAPAGTVEIAPYSAINESVVGSNGTGQLLVSTTLLGDIVSGGGTLPALVLGGFTPLANGTVSPVTSGVPPTASASNVTIDGALNLTGTAAVLTLQAIGSVTEPAGPITVPLVVGNSGGTFSLTNPANAIGQVLITATAGDIAIVDGGNLAVIEAAVTEAQTGHNVFLEVASPGGTLTLGGTLTSALHYIDFTNPPFTVTAGLAGRISLVADRINELTPAFGANTLTVPGGTLELAPFSPINESVAGSNSSGQLLIDSALLSYVTPGITLRIGGYTNEPAGATTASPSAASVSIDGTVNVGAIAGVLDLQAIGGVTQTAPIVNVPTLTGTTGSTTLTNPNNTVVTLGDYTAGNGFALANTGNLLIAGTIAAGPSANFAVNGTLAEISGGIDATVLSGGAVGVASFDNTNSIAEINGFVVAGNQSVLSFNSNGNVLLAGTISANQIFMYAPASTITLGDGTAIVTGGAIRPAGTVLPATLLPGNGGSGAYLQAANVVQAGRTTVTGLNGGPSTLRLAVTGNLQFDPRSGLIANGTWLDLEMTTGTATGDVSVKALDVSFAAPAGATSGTAVPGSADLFGTVNGSSGPEAAGLGYAHPAPNKNYLFNNCEIGSSACLLSGQQIIQIIARIQGETAIFVPATSLLSLLTPALVLEPQASDNLLEMPVVSREDY